MTPEEASPGEIYEDALSEGRFKLQRCADCELWIFPPRTLCPGCGDTKLSWLPASGSGRVYSATVVRQKPAHGGDFSIALIDLDEGVRMLSSVRDCAPDKVVIGMAVEARIELLDECKRVVRFIPAKDDR
jgi:uncharacterized protein